MEMLKTVQDLKMEFHKEVETLSKTHTEIKIESKSSITLIETSKESIRIRLN